MRVKFGFAEYSPRSVYPDDDAIIEHRIEYNLWVPQFWTGTKRDAIKDLWITIGNLKINLR